MNPAELIHERDTLRTENAALQEKYERASFAAQERGELATGLAQMTQQLRTENAQLRAEIERLENLTASGVHSCGTHCQRPMCVLRRDLARVTAERDDEKYRREVSEKALHDVSATAAALRARVADLEAAASLHWITEKELKQIRASAESATPAKHPDTEEEAFQIVQRANKEMRRYLSREDATRKQGGPTP